MPAVIVPIRDSNRHKSRVSSPTSGVQIQWNQLLVRKGFAVRAANLLLSTQAFYFSAGQRVYLLTTRC